VGGVYRRGEGRSRRVLQLQNRTLPIEVVINIYLSDYALNM
jgi:hypothetical protein